VRLRRRRLMSLRVTDPMPTSLPRMILKEKHKNNVDCGEGCGRRESERMLLAGGDGDDLDTHSCGTDQSR